MNASEFLRNEVFRPLATIVIPGAIAALPWLWLVTHRIDALHSLRSDQEIIAAFLIFLVCIAVGMILEDLGAEVESGIWDRILSKHDGKFEETWHRYLCIVHDPEPIGQRYLRTVLLRMKFEVGSGLGLFFGWIGLCLAQGRYDPIPRIDFAIISLVAVVGAAFLLYQSYRSAEMLGEVRRLLVWGCDSQKEHREP